MQEPVEVVHVPGTKDSLFLQPTAKRLVSTVIAARFRMKHYASSFALVPGVVSGISASQSGTSSSA
jgi:hypothetical protein